MNLMKMINDSDDSHDKDGGGDERGSVETSLTVNVLPLSLVHLPSTVFTAPTYAEAHANDGGKDHEYDTDGCTYKESCLVVDPLQEDSIYSINIPLLYSHFLKTI